MNERTIVYLGNFDRPECNAPGKRVYGNALILRKLGFKVILLGKCKTQAPAHLPISYGKDLDWYSFPNYKLYETAKYIHYVDEVIAQVGIPAIIIRYGSPGLAEFDRKLIGYCKAKKIKLIADVVDWLPSGGSGAVFNIIKRLDTFLEKSIYNKKSDGIIAISSYLAQYYKKSGCKTVMLPPVVEDYRKNKGENSCIHVVYAGVPFRLGRQIKRADEVKDRLDLAVRGIASVIKSGVQIKLDIYGISKEQYLTAYPSEKEIVEGTNNQIQFHGIRSMNTVQEAVNHADFTILLRNRNRATMAGFPTKIVESLACGTPVITTRTSDLEHYIVDGDTGFFIDISSEEKMVKALLSIFRSSKTILPTMKANCFNSKSFCTEKFEGPVNEFISNL